MDCSSNCNFKKFHNGDCLSSKAIESTQGTLELLARPSTRAATNAVLGTSVLTRTFTPKGTPGGLDTIACTDL